MEEHVKRNKNIKLPVVSKKYRYKFDEMKVGDIVSIICKKNERDAKFHSCRTRCKQETKNGKEFKAYADNHSVYYKRLA